MMAALKMEIIDQIIHSFSDGVTTTHIGLNSSLLICWTMFPHGVHQLEQTYLLAESYQISWTNQGIPSPALQTLFFS